MQILSNKTKGIVKICTKLKMVVPWALANDAIISENHVCFKVLKLRLLFLLFIKNNLLFKNAK